jgi:hypothetical protein
MDRRTSFSKRLRRVFNQIVEDLGGEEQLSIIQLTLVERFAWLKAHLQELEDQIAKQGHEQLDPKLLGLWAQANNTLIGLSRQLGQKRQKPAPLNLQTYINKRA